MSEPEVRQALELAAGAPLAVDPLVPAAKPQQPATVDPSGLAIQIDSAWREWLYKGSRGSAAPHASVYASAWRACERRMALELVAPDRQAPFDATILARFRRGDDRERDLLADLSRIGRECAPPFTLANQQQRFELRDRKGRLAIVGKVDARLNFEGGASIPLEVKAWSATLVDRIETFADLFDNPWTRSGGYQLLAYLFGSNQPYGFLLLDRSGLPLVLAVELEQHLDRMEEFLSRAERVLDHIDAGTLPDFHKEATECKRCSFYGSGCNPPLQADVVQVLTDPALEADLEKWHALRQAGKEFSALDADIKRRLRGIEAGIAGAFSITGTWSKSSRVELPTQLKKQFTITDDHGRFTLDIERL